MAITLAQAQKHLDAWIAADEAVSSGQEYSISTGTGNRSLTRVDADMITKKITYWERKVSQLSRKRKGASGMHSIARFS